MRTRRRSRWEEAARAHGECFAAVKPACTVVAVTAWQGLFDHARLEAGQTVKLADLDGYGAFGDGWLSPGEGGIWTPGALMGPALRKRLQERAGLTFSAH